MTVGTISDSEWQGFCRAVEAPELAEDKRFNTPGGRTANATERIHLMADILAKRTTADWLARLDEADVPCAPVLRRGEVMANEQVVARELIVEFDHPGIGRVRQPKPAARVQRYAVARALGCAGDRRARRGDPRRAGLAPGTIARLAGTRSCGCKFVPPHRGVRDVGGLADSRRKAPGHPRELRKGEPRRPARRSPVRSLARAVAARAAAPTPSQR